ncbi:MAG: serine/threonine-protein kinase PknK, partial [Myxococcota bacterium]
MATRFVEQLSCRRVRTQTIADNRRDDRIFCGRFRFDHSTSKRSLWTDVKNFGTQDDVSTPRYTLIRALSEGGAGRVWLAEDHSNDGRRVALKRLHDGVDTTFLSREFDTLRHLGHPNIATVLDFNHGGGDIAAGALTDGFEATEQPFLTEAFCDGPDFVTACLGLDLRTRCRLLAQVLRGLEYVHARGIFHGDVKPDNILVMGKGAEQRACIIDFGLAARPGELQDGVAGTLRYLAPELIRGGNPSVQADIYSFGVMAYEVIVGVHPFAEFEAAHLLRAHLEHVPAAPSVVSPDLPGSLDGVLMGLLEKDPSDRPASAAEVLNSLGAAVGLQWAQETAETLKGYVTSGQLVGRKGPLADARLLWRALTTPTEAARTHLLWLHGPAASGRTRFLREIGGDAQIDGGLVIYAAAGEGGPLGPVKAWLRELGVTTDPLQGALDRWDAIERAVNGLMGAVRDLMGAVRDRPVLLILDDADRLDRQSQDLLRVLLSRLSACYAPGSELTAPPLLLIVASTDPPERLGAQTSAYRTASLEPLSHTQLTAWLGTILPTGGVGLPAEFIESIARLTERLPGHVVSLLGAMVERGHLTVERGQLSIDPLALSAPLPASLREALSVREGSLDESTRQVLETLRVFGQATPQRLIASAADIDLEATAEALRVLVGRGLVGLSEVGGEVMYRAEGSGAGIEPDRRRELHGQLARTLMGLGGRAVVPGFGMAAVAQHARAAVQLGETRLAAAGYRAALAAAGEVRLVHAGEAEARLLGWAEELAVDPPARRAVALQRARLLGRLARFDEAAAAYESVIVDSGASGEAVDSALLGQARLAIDRGDYPAALDQATALGPDSPVHPQAQAVSARALLMTGRYDDALAAADEALKTDASIELEAEVRGTRALIYYYTERLDQALAEFEAAAVACAEADDPVGHATAVNGIGLVHHRRGAFDEAATAYERSLEIASQSGAKKRVAAAAMNIGTILHETGRAMEAANRYRESLQAAELLGDGAGVARAANNLGNLLIYLNQLPEARHWLDRSSVEAEAQHARLLVAYNQALVGKIAHCKGDLDGARRHLLGSVTELRDMGSSGEAGEVLIELGMVARSAQDAEGMSHFAASAEQQAKASGAEKQMAYVHFLRGEAARHNGDMVQTIKALRDALALADRHRLLDVGWRAEAGLARAYREQSNPMEARARFHGSSERILQQASVLSGRVREVFLAAPERAAVLEEARLAMSEGGDQPRAERQGHDRLLRIMEINRRLNSERDLKRLLEFILDSAIELTGAERGFVMLAEGEGDRPDLSVGAARNIDRESLRKQGSKVSQSVVRDVIESGQPV